MTTREQLLSVKLKATHQRIVILDAVNDCMTHPTVESIYEKLKPENPSISLATVYKTLETFVHAGLISKVATMEGMMRYDPNLSNHGHIYCHNTDEIIDYYDEDLNKVIVDFFKKKRVSNLRIKNITLNINGDKLDPEKEVIIK
jgi:Fur family peroxide stress response transcriptional regulator